MRRRRRRRSRWSLSQHLVRGITPPPGNPFAKGPRDASTGGGGGGGVVVTTRGDACARYTLSRRARDPNRFDVHNIFYVPSTLRLYPKYRWSIITAERVYMYILVAVVHTDTCTSCFILIIRTLSPVCTSNTSRGCTCLKLFFFFLDGGQLRSRPVSFAVSYRYRFAHAHWIRIRINMIWRNWKRTVGQNFRTRLSAF